MSQVVPARGSSTQQVEAATDGTQLPVRRATAARRQGRERATQVARRIGTAMRDGRLAQGRTQSDVAKDAGITQP